MFLSEIVPCKAESKVCPSATVSHEGTNATSSHLEFEKTSADLSCSPEELHKKITILLPQLESILTTLHEEIEDMPEEIEDGEDDNFTLEDGDNKRDTVSHLLRTVRELNKSITSPSTPSSCEVEVLTENNPTIIRCLLEVKRAMRRELVPSRLNSSQDLLCQLNEVLIHLLEHSSSLTDLTQTEPKKPAKRPNSILKKRASSHSSTSQESGRWSSTTSTRESPDSRQLTPQTPTTPSSGGLINSRADADVVNNDSKHSTSCDISRSSSTTAGSPTQRKQVRFASHNTIHHIPMVKKRGGKSALWKWDLWGWWRSKSTFSILVGIAVWYVAFYYLLMWLVRR